MDNFEANINNIRSNILNSNIDIKNNLLQNENLEENIHIC